MIRKQPWFERRFATGQEASLLPVIIERLRGTLARLEDRLTPLARDVLIRRLGDTWSIQENAGHLLDLEPLWLQRVDDLLARRAELAPADLTNRRTHEAHHNATPLGALHPRLRQPMNLADHASFVAEHDDYHLAQITELLREYRRA